MTTRSAILLLVGLALAGCQAEPVTTGRLGEVDYTAAFAGAREVFGQYYTIDSAEAATGRIVGVPRSVSAEPDRLLTLTPARERATLRLRRDGRTVWADIRVAVERLESTGYRSAQALHQLRDVPDRTPAQDDAPLTQQQNEIWRPAGNNLQIEQRILIDLVDRMKGLQAESTPGEGE